MMAKNFHLTKEGVNELEKERDELKVRRLVVAEKLKSAKEMGDLSENSDWASAQDEYKFIEGRLDEIEHILQNAIIIKSPKGTNVIQLGSRVTLQQNGKNYSYSIVGSLESNPEAGKISDESPIGKALMGKKVGENAQIKTPAGLSAFKITKIA